nr:MAG TPA: hypothetical protein [Caudoviricetes sp.]
MTFGDFQGKNWSPLGPFAWSSWPQNLFCPRKGQKERFLS